MKRHKQLWAEFVSWENFARASAEMLKGKRQSPAGARYFAEWEKEALCLMAELEAGTYAPGPYHYFEIHEPKRRMVAAAPLRDRVVHHALVQVLEPLFEPRFIEDSFACRKGKGTHAGMRRAAEFARRFPWVVKCDIQRYFPSIDQSLLSQKIQRVVGDKRLLDVVELILASHCDHRRQEWPLGGDLLDVRCHRVGLPIGNLTSQFFANIHLDAFDHVVNSENNLRSSIRNNNDPTNENNNIGFRVASPQRWTEAENDSSARTRGGNRPPSAVPNQGTPGRPARVCKGAGESYRTPGGW